MKVSVEIITGTFIDTEVNENATVRELKEKIAAEVKLSVKRLILVVGDEEERRMVMENEDEIMLRDLGLREDSHVYLFFKHLDLVSKEERSRGDEDNGDDASMEEISSVAEEEKKMEKIDGEEGDRAMKNEEENRDAKVEDEETEKTGEAKKDEDNDVNQESKEVEEGDNKKET